MKALVFLCLFISNALYASIPIGVHPHEMTLVSPMPTPYKRLEVKITIDPETHDVSIFKILLNEKLIVVPQNIISELKNVSLNTLATHYEIWTEHDETTKKAKHKGIFLSLEMEYGEMYTVQKQRLRIHGRDEIKINISPDNIFSLKTRNVESSFGNSRKGMW